MRAARVLLRIGLVLTLTPSPTPTPGDRVMACSRFLTTPVLVLWTNTCGRTPVDGVQDPHDGRLDTFVSSQILMGMLWTMDGRARAVLY